MRRRLSWWAVGFVSAVCLLAWGCGSAGSERVSKSSPQEPTFIAADASTPDAAPALPDVVFSLSGHVDGGSEGFDCVYVTMPTDRGSIAVPSAESHYTPGSHHFLVYRTSYDSVPDGGDGVHPCTDSEQFMGITGSYYEAQTPDAHRDLPKGVAHIFKPGEVLLMQAHYLNPAASGFDTHVDFRLHTTDPATVEHEAGSFFFYNPLISIPPMAEATVTRTCPITHDVNLALLWSHMHSRGVAFTATTDDADAAERIGDLYSTTTWSEPQPRVFPDSPPVTLHAGSTITYSCKYLNMTPQTIVQGQSAATNEMCILHGMYWPRLDSTTELCLSGQSSTDVPPADAGADASSSP
jgi:hypothetical protein